MAENPIPQTKPVEAPDNFEIHASVVFQLGESLITDSVQALTELVKNSYDADATYCRVSVLTVPKTEEPFKGALGSITVEDNGTGMSLSDIKRGWLTISNSGKREFKKKKLVTNRKRTPLGDKGLGRLGTQRLGKNLELSTKQEGAKEEGHHVWFSWDDFLGEHNLSDVKVHYEVLPKESMTKGSRLVISGLREIKAWQGDEIKRLTTSLSQVISPYGVAKDFELITEIDGQELELLEVGSNLRHAAQVHYNLKYAEGLFLIDGKVKLSYIRPDNDPDRTRFAQLVDVDGGKEFFEFLVHLKKASLFQISRSDDPNWFVNFRFTKEITEIKPEFVDSKIADPGPFSGEVDFFSLGQESNAERSTFDSLAEFRKIVTALSGIKVYRDGFGIRVASDWLNLGKQWTKATSYYTLKPQNTLGYIALSARDNAQLEETTDREGFKETPYYRNFYSLLGAFVEFSADAQEFVRRGWTQFRDRKSREDADVPEDTRPEALVGKLGVEIRKAASFRSRADVLSKDLRSTLAGGVVDTANPGVLSQVRGSIERAGTFLNSLEDYLGVLVALNSTTQVVQHQIESLRRQLDDVYEVIALGLVAEALSHEISNVATQLAQRTSTIEKYVKSLPSKDVRLLTYMKYVHTSITELRRQLLFLEPSLRYVRDRREKVDVQEFVRDLFKHYTQHFATKPISVDIKSPNARAFRVEISRGKFVQVLDNLFLNSEYWLLEDIRMHRIPRGVITIEIDKPFLRVKDNGQGVSPTVESALFEAFVSAKGKGKGRGLGLYIVRQLLAAEGCTIDLLPERNKFGRLYVFEINLTGVLSDN